MMVLSINVVILCDFRFNFFFFLKQKTADDLRISDWSSDGCSSDLGSGGAIALAAANRVLMFEHAVYSVISPEGCASILWRTSDKAPEAAAAMKMSAEDLLALGIIDRIVPEPVGGAHRAPEVAIPSLGDALAAELDTLADLPRESLLSGREETFPAIGRGGGGTPSPSLAFSRLPPPPTRGGLTGKKGRCAYGPQDDDDDSAGGFGRRLCDRRGRRAERPRRRQDQDDPHRVEHHRRRAPAGRRGASAIVAGIRRRLCGTAGRLCRTRGTDYRGPVGPVQRARRFHRHPAQLAGQQRLRDPRRLYLCHPPAHGADERRGRTGGDRKSTRLNSSH